MAIAMLTLTSCAELASMVVEDTLQSGLQMGQTGGSKKQRSTVNEKQLAKQREQLKKEGKCPVCSGMGKTPDGLYTCETCKGTGKYNETNNQ